MQPDEEPQAPPTGRSSSWRSALLGGRLQPQRAKDEGLRPDDGGGPEAVQTADVGGGDTEPLGGEQTRRCPGRSSSLLCRPTLKLDRLSRPAILPSQGGTIALKALQQPTAVHRTRFRGGLWSRPPPSLTLCPPRRRCIRRL